MAAYDLVTAFDAIHDQAHPATVLAHIRRALRPDGTFLMVDINASSRLEDNVDLPGRASSMRTPHPLHEGFAGPGRRRAGHGLGRPDREVDAADAGFASWSGTSRDPFNAYFVAPPDRSDAPPPP